MADLLSANRDAFGATLRPSLWEGVMKTTTSQLDIAVNKNHCNHRATTTKNYFSRREIFLPRAWGTTHTA